MIFCVDATEVLKIIADINNGGNAILLARAITGRATEMEEEYAALFFHAECPFCEKRPFPHMEYEYFRGYHGRPPLMLGHWCGRGGEMPSTTYHTFKTTDLWDKWVNEAVVLKKCKRCGEEFDEQDMNTGLCEACVSEPMKCTRCDVHSDPRDLCDDEEGVCYHCRQDDLESDI